MIFLEGRGMASSDCSLPMFATWKRGPFSPAAGGYAWVFQVYRTAAGPASFNLEVFDQARLITAAKAIGLEVDWSASDGLADALLEAVMLKRWWDTVRPVSD